MRLRSYSVALLMGTLTACGSGEITPGDIYTACVEAEMREFDFALELMKSVADDGWTERDERTWRANRRKENDKAKTVCGCNAETLPNRIAQDRLDDVLAVFEARGTLRAKAKLEALSEAEQEEYVKCEVDEFMKTFRKDGLID